jgi:hypothetical protein
MKEIEIIEEEFDRIDVPIEESGDKTDYYYYKFDLNDHITLSSNASDEIDGGIWKVYCYELDIVIKDLEDLQTLIALFKKCNKIV